MAQRAVPHPRLVRVTGGTAAIVLALGVATVVLSGRPATDVVLDGPPAQAARSAPQRPPAPAVLPAGTTVDLPVHDLDYLPDALRVGTLRGDPAKGCAWIEMDGAPHAVRWPAGTQAHFPDAGRDGATFQLLDRHGQVVGTGGDEVYFTGASSGAAERLDRCHVGEDRLWYVGRVTTEPPS